MHDDLHDAQTHDDQGGGARVLEGVGHHQPEGDEGEDDGQEEADVAVRSADARRLPQGVRSRRMPACRRRGAGMPGGAHDRDPIR